MAATELVGCELAWVCEYEPPTEKDPRPEQGGAKLLAHRYPDVPNLGDITAVDWDQVEPVDVLTGGFPCTDLSLAGAQAGLKPGTRSGLWSQMAYAIARLEPALVLIENVRGLASAEAHSDLEPCPWCVGDRRDEPVLRAFGAVLGDLASLGFDAVWCGVRASDVGAPHSRFRFFVAAARNTEVRGRHDASAAGRRGQPAATAGGSGVATADARCDTVREQPVAESGSGRAPVVGLDQPAVADTHCARQQGAEPAGRLVLPSRRAVADPNSAGWGSRSAAPGAAEGEEPEALAGPAGDGGAPPADTDGGGLAGDTELHLGAKGGIEASRRLDTAGRVLEWGPYEPAIRRWEAVLGRPAPAPTVLSEQYLKRLARHWEVVQLRRAGLDRRPVGMRGSLLPPKEVKVLNPALPEWMMGLPDGWITAVPGLSRAAQLKLAGNGVVPRQAVAAYRYLLGLLDSEARSAA